MHPEHRAMLAALQAHALHGAPEPSGNDSYSSSGRPYLRVPVPKRRLVAREWLRANRKLPTADVIRVVDSLFAGESHEEKTLAAIVLAGHAAARATVSPEQIHAWLDQLHGWAEIDTFCHNVFTADELLASWRSWSELLTELARDHDADHRRAALVFLVGPVRHSDDEQLRDLAFTTIDRLQTERDILITKAVSWLLRALAERHGDAVAAYVAANEETLPRVAVRETLTKLRTGTKRGDAAR